MKEPSCGTGGSFGGMAITNANGQTAAVNAMWGLMNTYDTHKNVLGWSSLDGNNTATHIAAHVNTAYDNTYYDSSCKCMYIGDAGSSFNNLGSIDVIGHEMGHGITDATSGLIYSQESGGLNESSSDIAGEMVEAYARAGGTGTSIPNTGNNVAQRGLAGVAQDERHRKLVQEAQASYQRGGDANIAQAQEALRQVLQERPAQREALALKSRIGEAQSKSLPADGKLAAAYRKPVTLEFRDAPLRSVRDTSIEEAIARLLGAKPAGAKRHRRQVDHDLPEHAAKGEGLPAVGGAHFLSRQCGRQDGGLFHQDPAQGQGRRHR